jgi:PBP1b-binding outer membrane lipoprotein LpoB
MIRLTHSYFSDGRWSSLLLVAALLSGCATTADEIGRLVTRVDPTKQSSVAGTGIESNNILEVADKMVRSMLKSPAIALAENPPTIALLSIKNNTRFPINKRIFLALMKARLNSQAHGKMRFLARDELEAIRQERKLKREGKADFDSMKKRQSVAGADYFLTGRLEGHSTAGRKGVSDLILYTFKLIDSESSVEVWEDFVHIKKEGLDDIVYR